MKFEKTNSKQLEHTITILMLVILLMIHMGSFIQTMHIYNEIRVELGSLVLSFSAVLLLMFDIMMILQKENRKLTLIDIIVALSVISIIISYFVAEDKDIAVSGYDLHAEGVFVLISYIIVFYSALYIKEKRNLKIMYWGLTMLAVFEVGLGVAQAVIQPDFMRDILDNLYFDNYRAYGTLENPNTYGSFLALFLGLETILLFYSSSLKEKVVHSLLVIIYSYGLFLSGTRGAMLGYGMAALIFSIVFIVNAVRRREKVTKVIINIGIVIGCCIIGFLMVYFSSKTTFDDVTNRVSNDSEYMGTSIEYMGSSRLRIWEKSWEKYIEKPIFGIGVSSLCMTIFMSDYILTTFDAHNRYLQVLCTQGAFGLFVYLLLNTYILISAISGIRKGKNKLESKYVMALLMSYTAYMIADFFCIGCYGLAPFIYLVMGLMVSRKVVTEESNV